MLEDRDLHRVRDAMLRLSSFSMVDGSWRTTTSGAGQSTRPPDSRLRASTCHRFPDLSRTTLSEQEEVRGSKMDVAKNLNARAGAAAGQKAKRAYGSTAQFMAIDHAFLIAFAIGVQLMRKRFACSAVPLFV